MRPIHVTAFALAVAVAALAAVGYRNATDRPIVRRLTVHVADYPATARPLRIALFSDLHVQAPDMPPERVERIVEQVNALRPDIDIIAGDFLGHSFPGSGYSIRATVAPLTKLKTRLGAYAVLGNNDYQFRAVVQALEDAGVDVLMNEATEVGPLALGGLDGRLAHSRPANEIARRRTYAAMARLPGIKVLIAHRPDEVEFAPAGVSLVLAGHTHCGQIVLPLFGPLLTGSDYGRRYACGVYRVGAKLLLVTAGLGTSHLPVRIGAPPDIWLISIVGKDRQQG